MPRFFFWTASSQQRHSSIWGDYRNTIDWQRLVCWRQKRKFSTLTKKESSRNMSNRSQSLKTFFTTRLNERSKLCRRLKACSGRTIYLHGWTVSTSGLIWMVLSGAKIISVQLDLNTAKKFYLIGKCRSSKALLNYHFIKMPKSKPFVYPPVSRNFPGS